MALAAIFPAVQEWACPTVMRRFLWWTWRERQHRGFAEIYLGVGSCFGSTLWVSQCTGCGQLHAYEGYGP